MRIKKGDNVVITAGKDKGKTGKVLRAFPREGQVVVEGVNTKKRHQRARQSGKSGQIVEFSAPIDASNVQLVDPKTNKPTRIGMQQQDGKKVRVAKKSGSVIA